MFVKVEADKLVVNAKYKIEFGNYSFIGYFKGIGESAIFVYHGTLYEILPHRSFYKFVSDNPQSNMERRAVTLIVRNLIGDEYFEW